MEEQTVAKSLAPKEVPAFPDTLAAEYLDFERLRAEGLGHIQDLSGKLWTDHNVHDPGITILEELCYALTDLGYRLHLPDEELLAPDPQKVQGNRDDNFFSAAEILSCNPVTILDWRKLLLDVVGVQNVWLEPIETQFDPNPPRSPVENALWKAETEVFADSAASVLTFQPTDYPLGIRGIYKVYVELEPSVTQPDNINICNPDANDSLANTLAEINRRLHAYRNLCEDFLPVQVLADEPVSLCAEIEIDANAQPDDVLLAIFERLQGFFSPSVQFYTLRQLLDGDTRLKQKRSVEEAFAGRPLLNKGHGFIDTAELEQIERRSEIHVSDIYRLILGDGTENGSAPVAGVSAIQNLRLINQRPDQNPAGEEWRLPLTNGYHPTLAASESVGSVTFYKRGIPYKADVGRVLARFERRLTNATKVFRPESEPAPPDFNLPIPTGTFRPDLGDYYSIQRDFPRVYGIGEGTLTDSMPPERWYQAFQLKGYLLFYDHLLANFLVQVANVRSYFNLEVERQPGFGKTVGSLDSVPLLASVLPFFENSGDIALESPLAAQKLLFLDKKTDPVKGAPLASAVKYFPTPQDRDQASAQVVAAFDDDSIQIATQYDSKTARYHLLFTAKGNRNVVLRSIDGFDGQEAALQKASAWGFIGSLPSSYEKIDDARNHRYSFQLLNTPPQYQEHLSNLEESDAAYFQKKNRLLDHLLHRFAEDFTDYSLLMFAMAKTAGGPASGGLELSQRFATDKARFLKNYPEISRNRSKAFDYGRAETTWEGDNISGLENRVGNLIGIAPGQAVKTLNFFDTLPQAPKTAFEIYDHDGATVLLRSITQFSTGEEAQKAHQETLVYGADLNFYQPVECLVEQVYGFKLLNDRGCPLAEHPETFGSAVRRDRKMRYVAGLLRGQGIMHDFVAETQGSFFEIFDDTNDLILRAASAAADDAMSVQQFLIFADQADANANWLDIDEPLHQGYSFAVQGYAHAGATPAGKKLLAVHPVFYPNAAMRDSHREQARNFVQNRRIGWKALLQKSRYRWQISDGAGTVLLESLHFFRKKRQTAKAAHAALLAVQQPWSAGMFEIVDLGNDHWIFYVLQKTIYLEDTDQGSLEHETSVRIAAAPTSFPSRRECEAAIRALKSVAIALDAYDWTLYESKTLTAEALWEQFSGPGGAACLVVDGPRYRLSWFDRQGKLGLLGEKADFESPWLALASVFQLDALSPEGLRTAIDLAADPAAYFNISENEGCAYGFGIAEHNPAARAEYPDLFTGKNARTQVAEALVQEAGVDAWPLKIHQITKSFSFEVRGQACDGRIEVILRGSQQFAVNQDEQGVPGAVKDAYQRLLHEADSQNPDRQAHFEVYKEGKTYSFQVHSTQGQEPIILAKHPRTYRDIAEAQRARNAALAYLSGLGRILEYHPVEDKICACFTSDGISMDADSRNWRLSDEEDRVASYARLFATEKAARDCLDKQAKRFGPCRKPDFSVVWQNDESVVPEGNSGGYRFILRDAKASYWQSIHLFDSESEARAALDAALVQIMDAARNLSRYKVRQQEDPASTGGAYQSARPCFFVIELLPVTGTIPLAESIEKPLLAEDIARLMVRLHRHALQFPLVSDADGRGWRFQTYDLARHRIEWQSVGSFPDKSAAEAAFRRFLDLLKAATHYRVVDDCNRHFRLELVETLLQGTELFHTQNKQALEMAKSNPVRARQLEESAAHFAWQRVDGFLDQLARAGDAAFVPTVDYLNCCGYGFALAGEGYRIARHSRSYHTRTERERARDQLFDWWKCRNSEAENAQSAVLSILSHRQRGFFEAQEFSCNLRAPDGSIYAQTLYKNRLYSDQAHTKLIYEYPEVFAEAVDFEAEKTMDAAAIAQYRQNAKNEAKADAGAQAERLKAEALDLMNGLTGSEILENLTVIADFEPTGQAAPNDQRLIMHLAVNRPDGSLIGVIDEWASSEPEVLKEEIKALYCQAMHARMVELPAGGFGFEFRRPTRAIRQYVRGFVDPKTCLPIGFAVPEFEVVWENILPFASRSEAKAAADIVENLLSQKSNYGRSTVAFDASAAGQDGLGSPSLEIINPAAIIAQHPRTYATREARNAAWQTVRKYIHTEGMHLVEHILLRPRHPEDQALLPIVLDDDDIQDFLHKSLTDPYAASRYIEGADPYSFIATVVLPAWSQRLRDLDFRSFFENTLRREAPAHVALRLFWVRPEIMHRFERHYRRWALVAGQPGHADFAGRKACLIEVLSELINTFPDAVLTDCESGVASNSGGAVVLDKTTLN